MAIQEQGFHRLIEILPEALVVVSRQGELRFANAAARRLLARPGGELPEKPLGFPLQAGTAKLCVESDGNPRLHRISVAEAEWEGEPAWVATLHGIGEQEQAREQVEAVFSHIPALIYLRDKGGRYRMANPSFANSAGLDEVEGKTDAELFPAAVAQRFAENHRRIVRSGESLTFEVVIPQAGGERAYLCNEVPLRDAQGQVYAVAGIRTDITERKQIEESLRESEALQRAILEFSLDGVVRMDANERILDFNPAAEQTFGYSREEVLGRPMTELLIAPGVRGFFHESLKRCQESGSERLFDKRVELTAMHKNGDEFPIETAVSVARHGGEPIFTAVLHDITQRKQAHQELVLQTESLQNALGALERGRARERQVLASISSIFIGLDDNGQVTHWNPAAERQFGLPDCQAIGRSLGSLEVCWPVALIEEAISRCTRTGEPARLYELPVAQADGRERILTLSINRIESRDRGDSGVVVVGSDITERKAMETQLLLAQKMESIGQLAAGIAHEINTPTQYVSDNTRFLRDSFNDLKQVLEHYELLRAAARQGPVPASMLDQVEQCVQGIDLAFLTEEIPKAIDQSLDGLNRVAEIVRAMKQFSHPDQDAPELANLNAAIGNTVTVARNEWKYVADMELDLDEDLPAVPCMVGRFNQVILNLIVNAAHAIAEVTGGDSQTKGKIRISTREQDGHVEIRVADTGAGIPERIRNRVFDPFFTTKQVGKGTGQGLAIAHNIIVEKHGGAIGFESVEGKGTTFLLRLPLGAAARPAEVKHESEHHLR